MSKKKQKTPGKLKLVLEGGLMLIAEVTDIPAARKDMAECIRHQNPFMVLDEDGDTTVINPKYLICVTPV